MERRLWSRALAGGRTFASASALAVLLLGATLDDLRILRVSALQVGVAGAVLMFAFGPPWFATRISRRASRDPARVEERIETALVSSRVTLALAAVGVAVWLALYAAGRTPRW